MMDGDTTVVDASVPKFIFNGSLTEVADFSDPVGPMLELWHSFPKLSLETADKRPAECMDRIAMNERASVGAGVDLVLRNICEGDARDLLMSLRQNVLVAVDEEVERLDERVGLSGTGASFDEEALFAVKAAIHLGEGFLARLLGRIQFFRDLSHLGQPQLRG